MLILTGVTIVLRGERQSLRTRPRRRQRQFARPAGRSKPTASASELVLTHPINLPGGRTAIAVLQMQQLAADDAVSDTRRFTS
ncbi:hypothetical protein [Sandaracinobacteroides hominis]|uniref:hypothetical protein n=1 Tax=Sandaracinobacteroides hominis TaxID=2780086 RepID=UPI0018F38878|nr:hypothetical protein [Sandaracinobacteroides hominis]